MEALANPWIAGLTALFLWWFSTGAILWIVRRADRSGRGARHAAVLAGAPFALAGLGMLQASFDDVSAMGAYQGFIAALIVWGWVELTFLTGVLTGPLRAPCPPELTGWPRFTRAVAVIAWHEVALLYALALIFALGQGAANQTGLWTFAILFGARILAKLNLFLGAPRIHTEFLPRPLAHIPSYFRQGRPGWFYAVSITVLTLAVGFWLDRTIQTGGAGFALLTALTALALLEHWLMVLPLPDERLWRWMIPAPNTNDETLLREGNADGL